MDLPKLPVPIFSLLAVWGIGAITLSMLIRAFGMMMGFDERFAIIRFCARISDPFVVPMRRLVPRNGFIDLSFLVAWFMLSTLQLLILQALPNGW